MAIRFEGDEKDGYLFTGYTHNFGAGSCDAYRIRLNTDGKTLWLKTYGTSLIVTNVNAQKIACNGMAPSFGHKNAYGFNTAAVIGSNQ